MTGRVRTILDTTADGTTVTVQIGGRSRSLHIPASEMASTLKLLTDVLAQHKADFAAPDPAAIAALVAGQVERIAQWTTLWIEQKDDPDITGFVGMDGHDEAHIACLAAARLLATVLDYVEKASGVPAATWWTANRVAHAEQKARRR